MTGGRCWWVRRSDTTTKPDTLLVTASLLCAVQTAQAVLPAAARQRLAPAQGRLGLHAETDAPPEEELVNDLPKRARSFLC